MLNSIKEFIGYNENKIKKNNRKIRDLRVQISDYETVIEIIEKTDISENILSNYRNKIENCLVKIDSFNDDKYIYDETTFSIRGDKNKRGYRLGDKVRIKVVGANKEAKTIDFELVKQGEVNGDK